MKSVNPRNVCVKVIRPGMWIDAEGNTHFSIKDLLEELKMPYTPANREWLTERLKEMVKNVAEKKGVTAQIIKRCKPD